MLDQADGWRGSCLAKGESNAEVPATMPLSSLLSIRAFDVLVVVLIFTILG
jgi:hypothetical protein